MKFKINQKELSKHISIAQRGISSRTTLPILDGILLETIDNKLKITATDLEISIETFVECSIEEEGSIVINSRVFGDIVRKLPLSTVDIQVTTNGDVRNMNIKCENSEFNIVGNNPDEYPKIPFFKRDNSIDIPTDLLKNAVRQTVFATSQEELRPSLTGVLLEIKDKLLSFVALDGFRLSLRNINIDSDIENKMIVPARTLNEVTKIAEDKDYNINISFESEESANLSNGSNNICFSLDDTVIYSKLLEGQFFNYQDIIRKEHETKVKINRKDFQNSLERASLLAKEEKANLILLNIANGRINIESKSEIGNVHEDIEIVKEGEDVKIAFNARYLLEGIRIMDCDEIELNFMGSLNPCIITPTDDENYIYLVLPVRSNI